MNDRTLLTLGLLLGIGSGKPPEQWLTSAQDHARAEQARDPMGSVVKAVLAGSAAFYAAERASNPKVASFYDALVYVATSLSGGHSDVLATTAAGKSIGAALMAYGPALAAGAFAPPDDALQREAQGERSEAALRDIADKLDKILRELQSQGRPQHG